jgi:rod shape-determining protein MreB
MNRGIVLVGGGALIIGLPELLAQTLKIPVTTSDDPLTAVARGTGIVIENIDDFKEVLIEHDNELPPR